MNYQSKIAYAEKYFQDIINGNSLEQVREKLSTELPESYKQEKVLSSIMNMVSDRYEKELEKDIMNTAVDPKASYAHLSPDVLHRLQERAKQKKINESSRVIRKMVAKGYKDEEIHTNLSQSILTADEIQQKIDLSRRNLEPEDDKSKSGKLKRGYYFLIGGVIKMLVFLFLGRISLLGLLLIGIGSYHVLKADMMEDRRDIFEEGN